MHHERIGAKERSAMERNGRAGIPLICAVRQGTRPWKPARLEDISQRGFRIAWMPEARIELPLRIRIPGMQLLSADIRWKRENAIGCEFTEPLHVAVLDHIVRSSSSDRPT